MGRVYAVASAKGGVGKTTTTASLGTALAAAGHRVVVVDADVGLSNLARLLGVTPDGPTIHDALAGDAEPTEAVYEGPHGLDVVPGSPGLDAFTKAEPRNLRTLLDALDEYDVVLLDTGAGLSHDTVLPLKLADATILVATPTPDALSGTAKTREVAARLGARVLGLVLTQAPADPDLGSVAAYLPGVAILGIIPTDAALSGAVEAGQPVGSRAPDSPAAIAFRRLADVVLADAVPTKAVAAPSVAGRAPDVDSNVGEVEAVDDADAADDTDDVDAADAADDTGDVDDADAADDTGDVDDADADDSRETDDRDSTDETDADGVDDGGLAATLEAVETDPEAAVGNEPTAAEVVADAVEEAEPTTDAPEPMDDEDSPTETVLADEVDGGVSIPDAESDRGVDPADPSSVSGSDATSDDAADTAEAGATDGEDAGDADDSNADAEDAAGGRDSGDGDDDENDGAGGNGAGGNGDGTKKKGFFRRLFG